jgi:carboxymethylenebutenolidase
MAVAPHLYHRHEDPVVDYDDVPLAIAEFGLLTAEGVESDIDDALAFLNAMGVERARTGVVGFCMGGAVAFHTAVRLSLGAAVTFYGGGLTESRMGFPAMFDVVADLRTPWLGQYGDLDAGIPVADVEALRELSAGARAPARIIRYADAGHGFHCDARPGAYDAASAASAWSHTLSWLESNFR